MNGRTHKGQKQRQCQGVESTPGWAAAAGGAVVTKRRCDVMRGFFFQAGVFWHLLAKGHSK